MSTANAPAALTDCHYGIDHTDVRVRSIQRGYDYFTSLGFTVAPPSYYQGLPMATCAVVFEGAYFAVTGFTEPEDSAMAKLPEWVRARFTGSPYGPGYLSLGTHDAARCVQTLQAQGLQSSPPAKSEREVELDGVKHTAAFNLLMLPESLIPGMHIDFVTEHLTRQVLWRPQALKHANAARALTAIIAVHPRPAEIETAAKRLFGTNALKNIEGGLVAQGGNVQLRVLEPARLQADYPGMVVSDQQPALVGMVIGVPRADECAAFLRARGRQPRAAGKSTYILPHDDAQVLVVFSEGRG